MQYEEGVRRGGILLGVTAPDNQIDKALDILMRHHPVDLERRAEEWRAQGWTGYQTAAKPVATTTKSAAPATTRPAASQQAEQVIPVVEEEIKVGKRPVQQGKVRIYKHVTEKPVEEQVQLRDERVTVERRPVDRPVTDAKQAFRDQVLEVTETHEEPVVTKQARVVEEVVVGRDVKQHTETVRDTVRRTDVDVKQEDRARATGYDEDFRRLYDREFANRGITYEQLRPGFEYGRRLAADQRFHGRDWTAIEADARRDVERTNPGGPWERIREPARSAYERRGANI